MLRINYKTGICSICEQEKLIYHKSKKLCVYCYKRSKAKPFKLLRKPTGEGKLFEEIWNERKHVSFVSGRKLSDNAYPTYFAHVLPKKKYPKLRLCKENIVLLTFDEHFQWDNGLRSKLSELPQWEKMFELEQKLKESTF